MKNRILIIEDDDFIREMYEEEFKAHEMVVTASINGEEGLKALEQNSFDLVLLDIMMPGLSGIEVLKRIKENPKTKDVMVVLITNLGQESVIKMGHELGAAGYLIKSAYNPDQLVGEVKKFLDGNIPEYKI